MNTLNFPDVNVWVALAWRRHIHSEKARLWFEEASGEQFFFCRITQISVLRLLTTERALGGDVHTMSGAWKLWDRVIADERIAFAPEPDGLERTVPQSFATAQFFTQGLGRCLSAGICGSGRPEAGDL